MSKSPSILVLHSMCENGEEFPSSQQQNRRAWLQIQESTPIRCDLLLLPELPSSTKTEASRRSESFRERRNDVLQKQMTHIEDIHLNPCGMDNVILLTELPSQRRDFLLSITSCRLDLPPASHGADPPLLLPIEAVPSTFSFSFSPQSQNGRFFYVPPNEGGGQQQQRQQKQEPMESLSSFFAQVSVSFDISEAQIYFQEQYSHEEERNRAEIAFVHGKEHIKADRPPHQQQQSLLESITSLFRSSDVVNSPERNISDGLTLPFSESEGKNGDAVSSDEGQNMDIDTGDRVILGTENQKDRAETSEASGGDTAKKSTASVETTQPYDTRDNKTGREDLSSTSVHEESLISSDPDNAYKNGSTLETPQEGWDLLEEETEGNPPVEKASNFTANVVRNEMLSQCSGGFPKRTHQEALLLRELQAMAEREEEFVTTVLYGMASIGVVLIVLFLWVFQRLWRKLDSNHAHTEAPLMPVSGPQRSMVHANEGNAQDGFSNESVHQMGEPSESINATWIDSTNNTVEVASTVVQNKPMNDYDPAQDQALPLARTSRNMTPVATPTSSNSFKVDDAFYQQKDPIQTHTSSIHPTKEKSLAFDNSGDASNCTDGDHTRLDENKVAGGRLQAESLSSGPFTPMMKESSSLTTTFVSESISKKLFDELFTTTVMVAPASNLPEESSNDITQKDVVTRELGDAQTSVGDSGDSEQEKEQPQRSDCNEDHPERCNSIIQFVEEAQDEQAQRPKNGDVLALAGLIAERSSSPILVPGVSLRPLPASFSYREEDYDLPKDINCNTAAENALKHQDRNLMQSCLLASRECDTEPQAGNKKETETSSFSFSKLAHQWEYPLQATCTTKPQTDNKEGLALSPCSKLAKQWEQSKTLRRKKKKLKPIICPETNFLAEQHAEMIVASPKGPPSQEDEPKTEKVDHIEDYPQLSNEIVRPASKRKGNVVQTEKKVGKPLYISPFISPISQDNTSNDNVRNTPSPTSTEVSDISDDSFLQDYW